MVSVIGAIFIILSTTWAGFELSRHLSERPKQLRMLRTALQSLEAEIMYGHTPLHEASRKLAAQLPKPISSIFERFSQKLTTKETTVKIAWEESLQEIWKITALKKSEYEILIQFGETLGKHDRATEQKQIILTLTHLEREESEARDKQQKYEKMMKSLGFLSGLLIVILLL
ncbi:stage III sporulation protein SpoIIIAB [Heyndrickxia sporothermodurans]|uniref:stage III sporulation protein SpoIIIAB n=1 Tax=Heyndrickxia sporothermodurans TaxID=46224 RepID=UPI002DBA1220|nr:stage III sporulation protein SpoIIIAB [Heyndrickxia sporothermodurans]MEB6547537.1 stage III sporulation protein SpoIIIAB [Heyndrickxia sporothermodurans]